VVVCSKLDEAVLRVTWVLAGARSSKERPVAEEGQYTLAVGAMFVVGISC